MYKRQGVDSDFYKIKVLGQFPYIGDLQLISHAIVERAQSEVHLDPGLESPLVFGLDIARFGNSQSVLVRRRGRHVYPITHLWRGLSTDQLAFIVAQIINRDKPDQVFAESIGVGAGVVDILTGLGHPCLLYTSPSPRD